MKYNIESKRGISVWQLSEHSTFVEKWNTYNVLCKVEMTILFLIYGFKIIIFIHLIFKDYSLFCIDTRIIF